MARVFVMREILELTTEEICKELGRYRDELLGDAPPGAVEPARMPRNEVVQSMRLIRDVQGSPELLSQAQDRPLSLREKFALLRPPAAVPRLPQFPRAARLHPPRRPRIPQDKTVVVRVSTA